MCRATRERFLTAGTRASTDNRRVRYVVNRFAIYHRILWEYSLLHACAHARIWCRQMSTYFPVEDVQYRARCTFQIILLANCLRIKSVFRHSRQRDWTRVFRQFFLNASMRAFKFLDSYTIDKWQNCITQSSFVLSSMPRVIKRNTAFGTNVSRGIAINSKYIITQHN